MVSSRSDGVNLSGGLLVLRYRSATPINEAIIALKPAGGPTAVAGLIPTEISCHFADTRGREEELAVPLPATPGLAQTKEVVITFGPELKGRPIDLSITRLRGRAHCQMSRQSARRMETFGQATRIGVHAEWRISRLWARQLE